jgi:hypothetical protein
VAISFIGSAGGNAINAGAVTITLPAGRAVNDLILVAFGGGDDDFTQPTMAMTTSGYTEITSSTISIDGGVAGDANLSVWYKYHDGVDTTAVCAAWGGGADASSAASCMVFRGVALEADGGPLEIARQEASGTSGGTLDPAQVSGFTETTNWVVVAAAVGSSAGITISTFPTGYTTNPRQDLGNDTFDITTALCYKSSPTDPENPGALVDSGAGAAWATVTMVLKAAVAAPSLGTGRLFVLSGPAMRRSSRW